MRIAAMVLLLAVGCAGGTERRASTADGPARAPIELARDGVPILGPPAPPSAEVIRRREEDAQRAAAEAREAEARAIEARRVWVTRALQFWVPTLLGIDRYGDSLAEVAEDNPAFSREFSHEWPQEALAPRSLVVTPAYAIRRYEEGFHIARRAATRVERHMDLVVRVLMEDGRIQQLEILMPNQGFSRWFERENLTLVADDDDAQRIRAVEWAGERIRSLLSDAAPAAQPVDALPIVVAPLPGHTSAPPVPRAIMALQHGGVRAVVFTAPPDARDGVDGVRFEASAETVREDD